MYELHAWHHQSQPEHFKTPEAIQQEKSITTYLDEPECMAFVATDSEKVVGFITGHFCELISTVSKPVQMGSIDELYVLPEYRKQGIAEQLFHRLEHRLEDYGVKQIFVEVWDFNQAALKFYDKVKFNHHIHWMRKPVTK
ncbi:GNAT family N-acetyltransferase [Vibrio sp. JC009]|nr:GNAT family N-acetyltransferase [Vibrio sp. JC009]